jgi:hypothetical protein
MPFVDPAAYKLDLRAALEAEGWEVERAEPAPDAWWMNELWRIRSRWRPVGATLYVTFIGDRQEERIPPKRVGEIGVGREPVRAVIHDEVERFHLTRDWPGQMARIVAHAARLRKDLG